MGPFMNGIYFKVHANFRNSRGRQHGRKSDKSICAQLAEQSEEAAIGGGILR